MATQDQSNKMTQAVENMNQGVQSKLVDNLKKDLIEKENLFFREILDETNFARTKLPEEVFVKNFLPYFSGQSSIKDNPQIVPTWISIAGSPMAEVDVVDATGQVQFTVPAFYDTTVVNATRQSRAGSDIGLIVNQYTQEKNNLPQTAETHVVQHLSQKGQEIVQPSVNFQDNQKKWITIFERYGLSSPLTQTKQEDTNTGDPTEIIYD